MAKFLDALLFGTLRDSIHDVQLIGIVSAHAVNSPLLPVQI